MLPSRSDIRTAADVIVRQVQREPEYARTSHLRIEVQGDPWYDRHLLGPEVADIFSVTKSVLATLVGVAINDGVIDDLDAPLEDLLDGWGTPAAGLTWRHLLTMRRGAETGGSFDADTVMAQPTGWLERWRAAPQVEPPGRAFRYDDGAAYLLGAALHNATGDLYEYATRRLFQPLGIADPYWLRGPEGFVHGGAHLHLCACDLARLGLLWINGGRCGSSTLVDPAFQHYMLTPSSGGGPPENLAYGYLIWLADGYVLAGGWAGQHVICVPPARAVVVVTGYPGFKPGPPPSDDMPQRWRPAVDLVRDRLLPLLLA